MDCLRRLIAALLITVSLGAAVAHSAYATPAPASQPIPYTNCDIPIGQNRMCFDHTTGVGPTVNLYINWAYVGSWVVQDCAWVNQTAWSVSENHTSTGVVYWQGSVSFFINAYQCLGNFNIGMNNLAAFNLIMWYATTVGLVGEVVA